MIRNTMVSLSAGSDMLPVFLYQMSKDNGGFYNGEHKRFFNKFDSGGI